MKTYTRLMLQNAYGTGCSEIAERVSTRVWEYAKYTPDSFEFREKLFLPRTMAEKVLEILKDVFPGVSVSMDYHPEDNVQGVVWYRFDWS